MIFAGNSQPTLIGDSIFQALFIVLTLMPLSLIQANELEDELFGSSPASTENPRDNEQHSQALSRQNEEAALFGGNESESKESTSAINNSREQELFGGDNNSSTEADLFGGSDTANNSFKSLLSDKLSEKDEQFFIGGQYYHSFNITGYDNSKAKESGFSTDGVADIYFDAALDDGVRFFMKQKIQNSFSGQQSDSNVVDFSGPSGTTAIDQMWLKFHYQHKLYMTFGKQPASWGAGFVWAPTDFINEENASPFSLSDQRLGLGLVKFQYPFDVKGINLYGVLQTDQASTIGDIKTLFRAEKLFEQSELAVSISSKAHQELNLGFDYSTGLKWFDWYINAGFTKHDQGQYYERPPGSTEPSSDDFLDLLQAGVDADPDAVPANTQLVTVDRSDEIIKQVSTGLIYIKGYDDGTQLIINSEFFYNEKGYDSGEILTLLLLQNPSAFDPLYFSKRYLAMGFTRAGLGDASQSYGLQYIKSLSDSSGAVIANFGFKPYRDLNVSSNLIVFTGGSGVFSPFSSDTEALEETAERVAEGELVIPEDLQGNLEQLPPVLEPQNTDPITASVGDTSFDTPRYLIRIELSLNF